MALGLLLAWHARRWNSGRRSAGGALLLGVVWAGAFHLTPSLLPVMFGCLAFDVCWIRSRRARAHVAITLVGVVIACVPWTLRNYAVFGDVMFIRSNFGLELRMGNHEGAVADLDAMDARERGALRHPRTDLAEAERLRDLGEVEYMRRSRREALDWISGHPLAYGWLVASRAVQFWLGSSASGPLAVAWAVLSVLAALGLWRLWPTLSHPSRAAFVIPLVSFPLVYYLVVFMPRYAAPLTGILLVLAGAQVWRWMGAGGLGREDVT